ncbi:hypothetical protein ACFQ0G_38605 [Streptomyces chiangmaiensis]
MRVVVCSQADDEAPLHARVQPSDGVSVAFQGAQAAGPASARLLEEFLVLAETLALGPPEEISDRAAVDRAPLVALRGP